MSNSCISKQNTIKKRFDLCSDLNARYEQIIAMGKELPLLDENLKSNETLVSGCQSIMHLHTKSLDGLIYFTAASDALISAGLAFLLVYVYSGETAETILTYPPSYLDELGVRNILSANRANGLYHIHLKMKQEALKLLMLAAKT